jgi:hypothetical protein
MKWGRRISGTPPPPTFAVSAKNEVISILTNVASPLSRLLSSDEP